MKIGLRTPVENLVHDPFPGASTALAKIASLTHDQRMELLEAMMLCCEQVEIPLEHVFAPGVYMRKGVIPKGAFLIGHTHRTEHLTAVFAGKVSVVMDGIRTEFVGPCVFNSKPNTRKLIYAHEDAVMANIHPTTETDLSRLEEMLIVKSETSVMFKKGIKTDLMRLAESLVNSDYFAVAQGELICGQ